MKFTIPFQVRPIINDTELISACGLYCGSCRNYLSGKCQSCNAAKDLAASRQFMPRYFRKCKIRQCCRAKGYHTCASCDTDVKQCKSYNTFIGRAFAVLFNSDRAACIRYIREHGEEAFAEKMAWDETVTIKR